MTLGLPKADVIPLPIRWRQTSAFKCGDAVHYISLHRDVHCGSVEQVFEDGSCLVRLTRDSVVRIGQDLQPARLARMALEPREA